MSFLDTWYRPIISDEELEPQFSEVFWMTEDGLDDLKLIWDEYKESWESFKMFIVNSVIFYKFKGISVDNMASKLKKSG